ncbi:hypothetical protein HYT95_02005 [Candidatus Peregrinibacteria bacterium]|nr:hypothetical protein [Candidatus Peregrinibacteria bacterium]
MVSLEEQMVPDDGVAQQRRYPAPHIDDIRAEIRKLGVSDPDRLLPPQYWGEFNTCGG